MGATLVNYNGKPQRETTLGDHNERPQWETTTGDHNMRPQWQTTLETLNSPAGGNARRARQDRGVPPRPGLYKGPRFRSAGHHLRARRHHTGLAIHRRDIQSLEAHQPSFTWGRDYGLLHAPRDRPHPEVYSVLLAPPTTRN